MKNKLDENLINKENSHLNNENQKLPNINNSEYFPNISRQKLFSEKDSQDKKERSNSSIKLKVTEHYEIKSKENIPEIIKSIKTEEENQFEKDKNNFIGK